MFAPKAGVGDLPIAPAVGGAVQGNSMAKPVVIVVGADKGGVGKTTVSRTLLDYFSANNIPTRAFDTESPRGTLEAALIHDGREGREVLDWQIHAFPRFCAGRNSSLVAELDEVMLMLRK